ncbi:MAG: cobalamin-binding protein [Deltaproteobacteria bacterium HGW-Deltaproteobacteria-13]|jgi:methylmalonyl-CoA mutase cobalamin-binding domain/chain|nr:MAG: cobalamin-binding protein [Deltaproteobacteria bacterium HGW-Deltaproteobacteria-13]
MKELVQAFSTLEEDRVYQIIDEYLAKSGEPLALVNELSQGMEEVGRLFKDDEYALGELIYSGEIFKGAMDKVKPFLKDEDDKPHRKVIIGTVEGDIHDLGKNIVITLLECSGFQVIDLGVDVPASKFVDAVKETGARLVGMSLLLTTAMDSMRQAIKSLNNSGHRDSIKIMIGGAPTSERLKEDVGADFYGRDAIEALAIARSVFNQ